jgi:phosphoglycolate phosphatase
MRAKWQTMLPANFIALDRDPVYRDTVQAIVLQQARQTTKAKGDVATPLRALHQNGYLLAVVTNDDEESARQNLHDLGVSDLFSSVVGANSGHGSKPDPDGLLHCCNLAGVRPEESIMVGDTIADYGAARAAGCKGFVCIADAYEFRPHEDIQPEHVISSLVGLPALLGIGPNGAII